MSCWSAPSATQTEVGEAYDAPNPIAAAVWRACIGELEAPKPGNVSFWSEGHGMRATDFVASARCAADALGRRGVTLGARVRAAVEGTHAAVGCNTNLGIVLLCAPLAQAALDPRPGVALRARVAQVLAATTVDDAAQAFAAIRLAAPAGLGESPRHDVRDRATACLRDVMREAAAHDRIARQYVTDFEDVFELGVPALAPDRGEWPRQLAVAGVYLTFLACFKDTHIQRKLGAETAEAVRTEAQALRGVLDSPRPPEGFVERLAAFDSSLKARDINPGTSADLTVATLLAADLLHRPGGVG